MKSYHGSEKFLAEYILNVFRSLYFPSIPLFLATDWIKIVNLLFDSGESGGSGEFDKFDEFGKFHILDVLDVMLRPCNDC